MKASAKSLLVFSAVVVLAVLAWFQWWPHHKLTADCGSIAPVAGVRDVCIYPITADWKTCYANPEPVYLDLKAKDQVRWRVKSSVATVVTVKIQNNPLNIPDAGIPVNPSSNQHDTGPLSVKSTATAGKYKYEIYYGDPTATPPCADPNVILK